MTPQKHQGIAKRDARRDTRRDSIPAQRRITPQRKRSACDPKYLVGTRRVHGGRAQEALPPPNLHLRPDTAPATSSAGCGTISNNNV
jgi:hypothetical protein